jgi:hypothetical protein
LVIAGLLLAGGCKCGSSDEGGPVYARAKERAEALLSVGTPPSDPAYDEVLKDLASVEPESRYHAQAQALREKLLRVRSLAPRPLAQAPSREEDPVLAKKQAECVALAEALGRADAGAREGIGQKLRECREAVDRYREQQHESQTP